MDGLGLSFGIMGALGGTEITKLISDNILAGNYRVYSTDKNFSDISFTIPNFNLFYFEARCFNDFYFSGILQKKKIIIYVRYTDQNHTNYIEWDGNVLDSNIGGQHYYFLAAIQ